MTIVRDLWNDEQAATMGEYSLLLALLALGTFASLSSMSTEIVRLLNSTADHFRTVVGAA